MSHHQNAGQSYDIKIANRCFENVAKFIYFGMTIMNQIKMREEIWVTLATIVFQSSV
jgi:hypothetical protein